MPIMLDYQGKDFDEVDWGDHKFAEWLRTKDPKWEHKGVNNCNQFFDHAGNLLAIVFYMEPCFRRIFIPKVLNAKEVK